MGIDIVKIIKNLIIKNIITAIKKFLKNHKSKIIFEPGRSIVGNIGTLISKIIYIKRSDKKNFIILDAAMNDLMRPALYKLLIKLPSIKRNKNSKKLMNLLVQFVKVLINLQH